MVPGKKSEMSLFFLLSVDCGMEQIGLSWFGGVLNACFFLPVLLAGKNRVHTNIVATGRFLPSGKEFVLMTSTFSLTVLAWIFFRAKSLSQAFAFLGRMVRIDMSAIHRPWPGSIYCPTRLLMLLICAFIAVEWIQRGKPHALYFSSDVTLIRYPRHIVYYGLVGLIVSFSASQQTFIYFQF